jgi:hypothetical protein
MLVFMDEPGSIMCAIALNRSAKTGDDKPGTSSVRG